MSRFDTLDKSLSSLEKEEPQSIAISHAQSAAFVKHILQIFLDYYSTIIQPRIALNVIHQHSQQDLRESVSRTSTYTYLLNLIPHEDDWPYKIKGNSSADFAIHGVLRTLSWHPNVASQFQIELQDQYNNQNKRYANILQPIITLQVWGNIKPEKDSLLISSSSVGKYFKLGEHLQIFTNIDGGWDKSSSIVKIAINDKNIKEVEDILVSGLSIITPNILNFLTQPL